MGITQSRNTSESLAVTPGSDAPVGTGSFLATLSSRGGPISPDPALIFFQAGRASECLDSYLAWLPLESVGPHFQVDVSITSRSKELWSVSQDLRT